MAQPTQVKFTTPSNDWCQIDNSAASTFPTLSASTHLGYDTPNVAAVPSGSNSQGSNPTFDTGSVLIDISGNDTVYADPAVATFAGNPVSQTQPTFKTVTKVLQDSRQGINIAWKNPA